MEGKIFFNKLSYSFTEFASISLPKDLEWAKNSQFFVKNWLNEKDTFQLQTSGSTGKPKVIEVSKNRMVASAKSTIDFLQLNEGTEALLCMNPEFIGGRMMIVRALVGKWNLHVLPPSSMPFINQPIDFAAMVPLQIETLLATKDGRSFLNKMKHLIIGGATISDELMVKIEHLNCDAYQTFGMTETVSHIALRRLNGKDKSEYYRPIGDNEIAQDDRGCLKVKGSVTDHEWLTTNDVIELSSSGFKWLGRADLVVNSGGIKIQLEPLEKELSEYFKTEIFLWKMQDQTLGEKLVGMTKNVSLFESLKNDSEKNKEHFSKYHFPKEWVLAKEWCFTKSGKIDRKQTFERSILIKQSTKD